MRTSTTFSMLAAALIGALATGCDQPSESGGESGGDTHTREPEPSKLSFDDALVSPDDLHSLVAEQVVKSVVNVSVYRMMTPPALGDAMNESAQTPPEGDGGEQLVKVKGQGSGVIVRPDGIVLTTRHVIEGAYRIIVVLADRRELDAELVGVDGETDLAVLRVDPGTTRLQALPFGDSSALRLGSSVFVAGNPFGLGGSVSMGIVSAKHRNGLGLAVFEDFIQTDAAINPGNSGGALIDMEGRLLGISVAIASRSGGNHGIGFAVPSRVAEMVVTDLLEHGEVRRSWLGASIQDLDPNLADALGVDVDSGALVAGVLEAGAADRAGLCQGDVVVGAGDAPVDSASELRHVVAAADPGDDLNLWVVREGETRVVVVHPDPMPGMSADEAPPMRPSAVPQRGLVLAPLTAETRRRFGIPSRIEQGVVVVAIVRGSEVHEADVWPGDVIVEVNRDEAEMNRVAVALAEPNEPVVMLIESRRGAYYLLLRRQD